MKINFRDFVLSALTQLWLLVIGRCPMLIDKSLSDLKRKALKVRNPIAEGNALGKESKRILALKVRKHFN